MKKLMIAASVMMLGFAASAASVNWTASNIYQPGSTTAKIASGHGLVYYFCAADTATADVTAILGNTETTLAQKTSALDSASMGHGALNLEGKISAYPTTWNHAAGTYKFYAVIFADDSLVEGGKYVVTALTTDQAWDNTSDTNVGLGTQKTLTQTASNWASVAKNGGDVPEPTSAMLLLLGVAGLALKRKVA